MTWTNPEPQPDGNAAVGARAVAGGPSSATSAGVTMVARRAAVAACRTALAGLRDVLVACTDRDLTVLAGELGEIRALAGAGVVAVAAEAETRGIIAASQFASTAAWVADAAWHCRREAATIAKAAALMREPVYDPVASAVCTGDVDLASAVACGQQYAKLAPDLTEAAKPVVLEHLLDMACAHGPRGVRRLTDEIVARYGEQGGFDEQCERRRRLIDLSPGRHTAAGVWLYQLTVDGEGRAVLEAAIGPASAPQPAIGGQQGRDATTAWSRDGSGRRGLPVTTRDTRPVGRRRGEALIDALRRSTASTGRRVPSASPKAILMLTLNYTDLAARVETRRRWFAHRSRGRPDPQSNAHQGFDVPPRGGHELVDTGSRYESERRRESTPGDGAASQGGAPVDRAAPEVPGAGVVLGSLAAGELIGPGAVRKAACDAGIIPVVLGANGEILDQGRLQRLFTPGQIRALWRRDRHCTFPGCDVPAAWCDAHHLTHWADGGSTSLDNAALLCARHHTIVHRDELAGHVHAQGGRAAGGRPTEDGTPVPPRLPRRPGDEYCDHAPAGCADAGCGARALPHTPDTAVTWDLRPGSYRPPGAGGLDERLSA